MCTLVCFTFMSICSIQFQVYIFGNFLIDTMVFYLFMSYCNCIFIFGLRLYLVFYLTSCFVLSQRIVVQYDSWTFRPMPDLFSKIFLGSTPPPSPFPFYKLQVNTSAHTEKASLPIVNLGSNKSKLTIGKGIYPPAFLSSSSPLKVKSKFLSYRTHLPIP